VEVLSPGTERYDRRTKVPAYREIGSVNEILLIDSEAAYAEIFGRNGAAWFSEIVRGREAELHLSSIELRLPMAELYEGIDLQADAAT
jgi:Uma2 family endonuclease